MECLRRKKLLIEIGIQLPVFGEYWTKSDGCLIAFDIGHLLHFQLWENAAFRQACIRPFAQFTFGALSLNQTIRTQRWICSFGKTAIPFA